MTENLFTMDQVAERCGFFNNNPESNINNGYLCNHPDAEKEDGVGTCHRKSCPVAVVVDEDADLMRMLEIKY